MCRLDTLQLAHEQVRSRVVGIQVRRLTKTLRSLVVGTASVPSHAESDQHACGPREQAIALGEDLDGWLKGAMHQQIGSPIKEIGLARVQFRCALVLPNRFERIAQL